MNVVVLEDAASDIEEAKLFYQARGEALGDYFEDSVLSDLDSLILYAGVHSEQFGFHRALMKRFPYGIYYLVEDDTAFVYAVLDLRRDPGRLGKALVSRGPK